MTHPAGEYAVAFALTCLVELPLVGALLTRLFRVPVLRAVLSGLAANVLTHPLFWLAVRAHSDGAGEYVVAFFVGEAAVCAVEWLVLVAALRGRRRGSTVWPVSVLANMSSAALGLLLVLLG